MRPPKESRGSAENTVSWLDEEWKHSYIYLGYTSAIIGMVIVIMIGEQLTGRTDAASFRAYGGSTALVILAERRSPTTVNWLYAIICEIPQQGSTATS